MAIESEDVSTQVLFSNTFQRTIVKNTIDSLLSVKKGSFFFTLHIYLPTISNPSIWNISTLRIKKDLL